MLNNTTRIKLCLFINYFVFAILLNSVGIVILKVMQDYQVAASQAGVLEGYKDITIALVSFFIASFLPKLGYRRAMLLGLSLVSVMCLLMPLLASFWMSKILFATIGVSFALIKVSVYSTVGLITPHNKQHASFLSILEGVFMLGLLAGFWLFGYFIRLEASGYLSWLHTFWVLACLCALSLLLLLFTRIDEPQQTQNQPLQHTFLPMLALLKRPPILLFILAIFIYVFIEQGVTTWLPTFNHQVLSLHTAISVELTSILAASMAAGRIFAGLLLKRVAWSGVILLSLLLAGIMLLTVLPSLNQSSLTEVNSWQDIPWAAYAFPMIGFFIGPIYPILCSTMLSHLPQTQHSALTGHIVIFSALGGTVGSRITGYLFATLDGVSALMSMLLPITLLFLLLIPYRRMQAV
jgi:FHS family glucose/mannose:H+ symporter-like MFS transporter